MGFADARLRLDEQDVLGVDQVGIFGHLLPDDPARFFDADRRADGLHRCVNHLDAALIACQIAKLGGGLFRRYRELLNKLREIVNRHSRVR